MSGHTQQTPGIPPLNLKKIAHKITNNDTKYPILRQRLTKDVAIEISATLVRSSSEKPYDDHLTTGTIYKGRTRDPAAAQTAGSFSVTKIPSLLHFLEAIP